MTLSASLAPRGGHLQATQHSFVRAAIKGHGTEPSPLPVKPKALGQCHWSPAHSVTYDSMAGSQIQL